MLNKNFFLQRWIKITNIETAVMVHVESDVHESEKTLIKKNEEEAADFETAIAATGYGKFNILLLILVIPTRWAPIFEVTTTGYVFPAAQCDLNLSLRDKGLLNGVTYGGMISSALIWGFLFDKYGRRKLLIVGYFLDALFVILSSFSTNFTFLMVTKFFGGVAITGPDAAIASYFSELHAQKYRSQMVLLMGLVNAVGCIYLPLLAAFILPLDFKLVITENIVLHAWGLYFILNSLPSLLSSFMMISMPESPKFLMSSGKNEDALNVFRRIYSINTGEDENDYPIKKLMKEKNTEPKDLRKINSGMENVKNGWNQVAPLLSGEHLRNFLLVSLLQIFLTMSFTTHSEVRNLRTLLTSFNFQYYSDIRRLIATSVLSIDILAFHRYLLNTLRLWLPQLFQAINDYEYFNNSTSANLCEMLSIIRPSTRENETCFVNLQNIQVYINSIIVAIVSIVSYLGAGILMSLFGIKNLMFLLGFIGGCFGSGIYFAPNGSIATALIAGFQAFAGVGTNLVIVIIVNIFPTTLRTTTLCLVMMAARVAAMAGNIMFPYLIQVGCAPPFFTIALSVFACALLSLLIPKENKKFT